MYLQIQEFQYQNHQKNRLRIIVVTTPTIKDYFKDSLLNGCDIHRTSAKLVIMEGRNNMQS